MATANTTAKKKPSTTKATSSKPTTVVEEKVIKVEPKVEKRVFKESEGIPCRSITQGGLYMEGAKTKMRYEWSDYGDITYVEYADLASATRVRSSYVFGPLFMIDDDDFIEEFPQLKKFYTENYSISDLEVILSYPVDRMVEEIQALPKSAIESIKVLAASSINDGSLDSVSKIKALDELFGTKLSLLAEFKD